MSEDGKTTTAAARRAARVARLARELRANLKKRKARSPRRQDGAKKEAGDA